MIFSYWGEDDTSAVTSTIEAWSEHFPEYRVIGDSDVRPILSRMKPEFVDLYDRITIPACRSDVARLVFLYAYGGLYVDCHCHPADPDTIRGLLDGLDTYEVVLMNKDRAKDKAPRDIFWPRNGVIFAREASPIISRLLDGAIGNLLRAAAGQPPNIPDMYQSMLQPGEQNVWVLTGPGLYMLTLTEDPSRPINLDQAYRHRIKMIDEVGGPIRLYVHNAYQKLAPHWSAQQKTGALFAAA